LDPSSEYYAIPEVVNQHDNNDLTIYDNGINEIDSSSQPTSQN